jgi:threonine dehydratase
MFAAAGALSGTPLAPRPACRGALGRNDRAPRVPSKTARPLVRPLKAVEEPRRSETSAEDVPADLETVCADPVCSTRLVVNGQDLPAFEDVSTAHFRIRNGVVRTPLVRSRQLSAVTEMNIFLKHEWQQATGSFKERGARNSLLALTDEQRKKGVVAASAGNHALALAYHGAELGIPVTVLMPSIAPLTKITKCRALGANVILEGDSIADAALAAQAYVRDEGMKYINGFDDFNIIAGAGSVGLEILEDAENIDAIVVPVGGGGLIAGVALAVKTINPNVQIIGVEPSRCASMAAAMEAGEVVKVTMPGPTLADGLAVPAVGPRSFEVLRTRVDKLVTVSEKDISVALLRLVELEKLIQEGAGAAGIAAVLAGKLPELKGKNVAVLLCGGNIDTSTLGNVLERGLVNDERLIRFSCVVPDRPGGIAGLCATIAFVGASIKQINHERAWLQDDSHSVQVTVTCELTGPQMADHLYEALAEKYPVDFTRPKGNLSGERAAALNRNGQSPAAPPAPAATAKAGQLPAPVLYDYDTIVNNVKPSRALVEAVEDAFAQLANGKVDVPMPMHIGVAETAAAGPGDCHIKGGYIEGAPTWTVKLANVSFYKNVEKGLPAGSGVFVVCDAANGGPKAVLHENRYLTDLRTGAAGAVAVKHLAVKGAKSVAFIGTGVIAESMARSTATVFGFEEAFAYSRDVSKAQTFCDKMSEELGYPFAACGSAEDAVRAADVVFTQTPGGEWVLEESWLRPHALIVCSGSDQPTKNEIPPNVLKKAKVVTDITAQCARVGEVRSAIAAGVMTAEDVHAELGQIVSGKVKGRKGKELIVCDLTGTGAQDAAIGSYVMDVLD